MHLQTGDVERFARTGGMEKFSKASLENQISALALKHDPTWGGMGHSPKFIMPSVWQFLLRGHSLFQNPECLQMVDTTLTRVAQGGIYDQVGGGFSRYSVDTEWFIPHFEKCCMTTDNYSAYMQKLLPSQKDHCTAPLFIKQWPGSSVR